jgi:hypothetical protein
MPSAFANYLTSPSINTGMVWPMAKSLHLYGPGHQELNIDKNTFAKQTGIRQAAGAIVLPLETR